MNRLKIVLISALLVLVNSAVMALEYEWREVANQVQSGEHGWHDTTGAIMFAGSQMGFVGAGSFAQTANTSILKFWTEASDNAQRVIFATDANGYYTLNVNSGLLSATSTKKLTRGFHRFTMLVRRGVSGGNSQIAQVLVHVDGEELFNLGDGAKVFSSGPFRLVTFGGTSGNLVSGAMWESTVSCGNAESDAETIAKLDADATAKYAFFEVPVPAPSYAMPERGEMELQAGSANATSYVMNIGAGDWVTEFDLHLPNFASRSSTAYPAIVTLTHGGETLSLSANCNNNCELFLTGSNLTATYAYPVLAVIRNNGDVGSNVALAPAADGKVTLRLENRLGELRVYRNGKLILVTNKNVSDGGSIDRLTFSAGWGYLGEGTLDAVYFKAISPARIGSNTLVWSDEFEGTALNEANWTRVPTISNPPNWRQYASAREDLVTVKDGAIVLTGIKNDGSDPNEKRKFLCGQVWGLNRISFTKGVYEIRAKFEDQDGAWPALWMLPDDNVWPDTGEIDIVERLNSDNFVYQTVHHGPRVNGWNSTSNGSHVNTIDNETWNVYRVEWTDEAIKWYVNGKLTFTYAPTTKNDNTWPFTKPFYFILSQQLEGDSWVGTVDDESTLPVNMYVDYVRVYQNKANESQIRCISLKGDVNIAELAANDSERVAYRVSSSATIHYQGDGFKVFDYELYGSGKITIDAPGCRVHVPNARDFAGTILATEGTELIIPADLAGNHSNLVFSALQTQSSYYRGKDEFQPLIGLKAEELKFNTFWRLSVELPEDVDPAMITDFKLYKSSVPYFAFSQATELWSGLTKTRDGRKFKLDFQPSGSYPTINVGDYLWVCVKIGANAPANAKIDAKLTEVVVNGYFANVKNYDPQGYGTIYPYAFHVVPYWRLNNWTLNALTSDHFAAYTDIIAFYITIDANGNVGHGRNGEQFTDEKFAAAIDKMKKLRGNRDVRILAGVGFSQGNLPGVTADPVKRKRAAEGLARFVEKFGLDGIDFDWEYPTAKAHWEGWRDLVTDLKPLLFALPGGGKQVSIAVTGWRTQQGGSTLGAGEAVAGLYQQCDFVSMMSYDDDNASGHSTLALMQNDFNRAVNYGHLPNYKINGGLAFYTNIYHPNGSQNGYNWVVNNYPQYVDATDVFTVNGTTYTYNSIATIKAKCADALSRGGGVMIWANETDVALSHEKSATRAMSSVIRPTRTVASEVQPNADWTRFTTTTTSSPTWTSTEDGTWENGVYTVRFSPLKFTVASGASTVTMNLIAALPSGKSGALAGWKIDNHTVQLVYDAVSNRFDVTYDGTTTLATSVKYEPLDVTKPHAYTITVSAGSNGAGTYVYQDGNLIVNAAGVKWNNQKLNLNFTFGSAVDDSRVFYGMKIYAVDLNYLTASNTQDRILPMSVRVNGHALSTDEIRSAAKFFGPLVEEVNFAVASFDPETGTIEIKLNAPFVNGSVSVLGANALTGPWTRVATVYQPTESVIQIEKERMLGYNFFKVVIEEGRQALGPVEILELANLPSKDFPDTAIYHASGEQYRIPSIVKGGDIAIAAYDMRPYAADLGVSDSYTAPNSYSPIDIAGNYSTDGGETWTEPEILVDVQNCFDFTTGERNNSRGYASRLSDLGDVCMVYDEAAEKFFMMGITGGGLSARKSDNPMDSWDTVIYTRGNGVNDTWQEWTGGPADHPRSVRDMLLSCLNAKGVNTTFSGNKGILAGPGHGIQTKVANKGRLVIPMQYFGNSTTQVFAAYSDDHGASWQVTNLVPAGQNSQENSIVELDDGSWYMIAKNGAGGWSTQGRHLYRTTDFENWTYLGMFTPSSKVQGSILKLGNRASDGKGVYAMAFCTSLGSDIGSTRNKLYLYFGVDKHEDAAEPIVWDKENYIPLVEGATGSKGYNSMIMVDEHTLGVLYEANSHIYFRRLDVRDLVD